jgi:hypothetical protein
LDRPGVFVSSDILRENAALNASLIAEVLARKRG